MLCWHWVLKWATVVPFCWKNLRCGSSVWSSIFVWGHSLSSYARRGGGGSSKKRTVACKRWRWVDTSKYLRKKNIYIYNNHFRFFIICWDHFPVSWMLKNNILIGIVVWILRKIFVKDGRRVGQMGESTYARRGRGCVTCAYEGERGVKLSLFWSVRTKWMTP